MQYFDWKFIIEMASKANKKSTVAGQDKSSGKGKGKKKRQVSQNETKLSFEFYLSEGNTYMTSEDYNRAIVGYSKVFRHILIFLNIHTLFQDPKIIIISG